MFRRTSRLPSVPLGHEDRFGVAVLNNLLGGGMSSRLFQNIREKRGLAYAVFSEITPYSDAGMLTVYAGSAKETVGQLLDLIVSEFRDLKKSLVTEEELTRSKNHLKGSLMLSLEGRGPHARIVPTHGHSWLDTEGELVAYRRVKRYSRCQLKETS